MTTQRMLGGVLSAFLLSVSVVHILRGDFDLYFWYYLGAGVPLYLSVFFESKILKFSHVLILIVTGALISLGSNQGRYTGIMMLAFGYIQAFTYGYLETHAVTKSVFWGAAYFIIFALAATGGQGVDVYSGFLSLMACAVISLLLWINAKALIDKARRVDILEKKLLKEENETMKEAGILLAKEIRSKGTGSGCEG